MARRRPLRAGSDLAVILLCGRDRELVAWQQQVCRRTFPHAVVVTVSAGGPADTLALTARATRMAGRPRALVLFGHLAYPPRSLRKLVWSGRQVLYREAQGPRLGPVVVGGRAVRFAHSVRTELLACCLGPSQQARLRGLAASPPGPLMLLHEGLNDLAARRGLPAAVGSAYAAAGPSGRKFVLGLTFN